MSDSSSTRNFSGSSISTTISDRDASELLRRRFSNESAKSTAACFAERMQKASRLEQLQDLRVIGLGSCGSVFEISGSDRVYKKGSNEASIWQDFCLTNKVHKAAEDAYVKGLLQNAFPSSSIPKTPYCLEFHRADDEQFWTESLRQRFPAGHRAQQPLFSATRILPLPRDIREALIHLYFKENEREEAKDDSENKDCLVRLYLGERETVRQRNEGYSSLRNFELRLNMMEELELDISGIATEIAIGLAIMHWQAQVNGMDTEFVLGSSATWDSSEYDLFDDQSSVPHNIANTINFKRREIDLWILDFDKATVIEMTEEDIDRKLVPAFMGNDPYYPSPSVDEELWNEFCRAYLKASEIILHAKAVDKKVMTLPRRFLDKVLKQAKENESWDPQDGIVFED